MGRFSFRHVLLLGASLPALMTMLSAAHAANITISTAEVTPVTLSDTDTVRVTPTGSITTAGSAISGGMGVPLAVGAITNEGTLTSTGFGGIDLGAFTTVNGNIVNAAGAAINALFAGIGTSDTVINGTVRNDGDIASTSSYGAGFSASTITGGFENNGTITAESGLLLNVTDLASLRNTGDIAANAGNGLDMLFHADISGVFRNDGTLTSVLGHGVYMSESDMSGGLINTGTISGVNGIELSNDSQISGGIVNSGLIEGTSGIAINFNTNAGVFTPVTLNGGRVVGDIFDFNFATGGPGTSSVTVGRNFTTEGGIVSSSLSVSNGAALTISAGTGVTVGDMQANGGTIRFGVQSTANYGALDIVNTGNPLDLTGTDFSVYVGPGATLADGDEMRVASGGNTIIGGPGATKVKAFDNSALWDFFVADGTLATVLPYSDGDLMLFVEQAAMTVNNNPDQDVIDIFVAQDGVTTDPDLQNAIDNMNNAPSQRQLDAVLSSVQPTNDTGAQQGASAFADAAFDLTGRHMDTAGAASGVSSGNAPSGLSGWGQVFGQVLEQDARGAAAGYDGTMAGFTMGVEKENFGRSTLAGLSLSYARTDIDSNNANTTRTDIDSYQLGLYAQHELSESVYLRAMAGYAFSDNDTTRFNVGGLGGPTAQGDFSANTYSARLEAGKRYAVGRAVLTPHAVANWVHYDPQGYTETGAGGLNLTVRGKAMDVAELGAGLKARWEWEQASGARLVPVLRMSYRYDLINDNVETTASFAGGGGAFSSQGVDPARGTLNLGTTLTYETSGNWDFTASYDLDLKSDYHAHAGMLGAVYRF